MNAASKLFVISAPSGAGKTTLVKSLIKGNENIKCSTSYTTRAPRINEKEGEDYFFISKEDIIAPLKSINFLKEIEVKKKYPNTIILKIYETKPVAILYKKNDKLLLDSMSNLIHMNDSQYLNSLPSVFGEDAEYNFINFFNKLSESNFPNQRIKNFYYFQIGRWDLELLNNQIIKYPADKTNKAIQQSIKLLNRKDFESYNIIDLRVHGKIVVE